ncbi:hypothetical protein [uncultured Devosia sp.]|uniref:hypothetical protein n=1 Tax=uncultured Devosia sp. TaxID=211434 RepID=UPI0035CB0EEC
MIIVRRQRRNAFRTLVIIAAVTGVAVVIGLPGQALPGLAMDSGGALISAAVAKML